MFLHSFSMNGWPLQYSFISTWWKYTQPYAQIIFMYYIQEARGTLIICLLYDNVNGSPKASLKKIKKEQLNNKDCFLSTESIPEWTINAVLWQLF